LKGNNTDEKAGQGTILKDFYFLAVLGIKLREASTLLPSYIPSPRTIVKSNRR
jgi:hypothetical protein